MGFLCNELNILLVTNRKDYLCTCQGEAPEKLQNSTHFIYLGQNRFSINFKLWQY